VVTSQEDERYRLSYQLHEEAGQLLSALQMHLALIRREVEPTATGLRPRVDEAVELTSQALEEVRALAQALRPPALDVVGLSVTLQQLCRDMAARYQLSIAYEGEELAGLPDSLSISFYRCLQEALSNVAKHAQARRVAVALAYDGEQVTLTVSDDGRGFDLPTVMASLGREGGLGLLGLQERFALLNGRLTLESEPGQGARLAATVPWPAPGVTLAL
jgi:signal transduction histidine kinase